MYNTYTLNRTHHTARLGVRYRGLGISKLQFLIKKNIIFFSSLNFFLQFLVFQTLDPELDSDPHPDPQLEKMLDPDPYPDPQEIYILCLVTACERPKCLDN